MPAVVVTIATSNAVDWSLMSDVLGQAAGRVVLGDNLEVLRHLPDESIDLIYVDPPFNTGKRQVLQQKKTTRDSDGDRI